MRPAHLKLEPELKTLLTFGDEGSQEAPRRTRTEPAKQGTAHHRRVGVGAGVHHWVSGDEIGGLLRDIRTGAAAHYNLDLIHIQVLEINKNSSLTFIMLGCKEEAEVKGWNKTWKHRYTGQTRNTQTCFFHKKLFLNEISH